MVSFPNKLDFILTIKIFSKLTTFESHSYLFQSTENFLRGPIKLLFNLISERTSKINTAHNWDLGQFALNPLSIDEINIANYFRRRLYSRKCRLCSLAFYQMHTYENRHFNGTQPLLHPHLISPDLENMVPHFLILYTDLFPRHTV